MKRLEQDQSKNGFTSLLLGLSALVSTTTNTVIQKALETVPTKQVEIWCQETLGRRCNRNGVKPSPPLKKRYKNGINYLQLSEPCFITHL